MTEVFTAHDITDLAGALPALFGFMPEHSLVAISTSGPHHRFGFRLRVDLPDESQVDELAALVVRHLVNQGAEGMVLMCIGDQAEQDLSMRLMSKVEAVGYGHAVDPVISLWIDSENATVLDINDTEMHHHDLPVNHRAVAMAVAAGLSIVGSRAEVAASYAHLPGELTDAVNEALIEVETPDEEETLTALARMLNAAPGDTELLADCIATLVTAGLDFGLRDAIWGDINRTNASEYACALRTAAVHAPEALAHPLYALCAFADWIGGDGARSLIAAERALELSPQYSMAGLIIDLLQAGISPAKWQGIPAA